MQKNILFISILSLFFGVACWFVPKSMVNKPLQIPGRELEEGEEKQAWELQMLADPATGKIPDNMRYKELEFVRKMGFEKSRNVSFTSRGPWNVGGRTRSVVIDVMDETHILAGSVSGGVWESKDAGASWERVSPVDMHPGVASIAQDTRPGHTNTWYWLSGECYGTSASGGGAFYLGDGLYKSTDNGTTWNPVVSTASGNASQFSTFMQTGWRVAIDPSVTNQDIVYIATVGAVYRSVDGGATWTAAKGGSTSAYSYFNDVSIASDGTTYLTVSTDGPAKGIWRSSDHGMTWANIVPTNFPAEYDRFVMGINPNNENEVYFLGSTPNYGHYLNYLNSDDWQSLWKYTYLSGDGTGTGGQWDDLSANLPHTGTQFDEFSCQGGYDLVVKVQPGTNHVFIGGTSLYCSKDAFTTADSITHIGGYKPGTEMPFFQLYPNHHPDIHTISFLPSNPNILYSGSDGGIHKTLDANADSVIWESCNSSYVTSQFYTVGFDRNAPNDPMLWGGLQDNANFITTTNNPQDAWKMTINGDGAYGGVAHNKSAYYFSIQKGYITKCDVDASGNLTAFKRIDPIGGDGYLFINPLVLDPNNDDIMYVAGGRSVWRNDALSSFTLDNTWDSVSTGWSAWQNVIPDTVSAISVSTANPTNRVYFGTNRGKIYRIDNANVGTPSITAIPVPGTTFKTYTSCIAIDPTDANKAVVVYSNYGLYSMYYTQDAGATWNKVAGNLEAALSGGGNGPSIRWVSIMPMPNGKKTYIAGTSVGVYFTDSLVTHTATTGTQWAWEGASTIGTSVVTMVETRPSDGFIAVATHGNGVFGANITNYVGISPKYDEKTSISVYPNPAKDKLNITIDLAQTTEVELNIYDLAGRKMISRKEEMIAKEAVALSTASLANGTYFYEAIAKGKKIGGGKFVVAK